MSLTNKAALLMASLVLILAPISRGDDYSRAADGSFSDTQWGRYSGGTYFPPPQGPPGGGDTATLNSYSVTASGGSVMMLGGAGTLSVSGSFTATTASGFTLEGSGICHASSCSFIVVDGGNLVTGTDTGKGIQIMNGGSETASTLPSGTQAYAASGGSLIVNSTASNLNLTLESGGTTRANGINNGQSVTISIDGPGSSLAVDQNLLVTAGFLDITDGGNLTVSGQTTLNGSGGIGGGGHWTGAGTTVSTSETMFIGYTAPEPGFSLSVGSGAVVDSGTTQIGSQAGGYGMVTLSGAGTLWEDQSGGFVVGQNGTGEFDISSAGHLLIDSGAVLGVGLAGGSTGTLTADGAGSLIDASLSAGVSIGESAGGDGNVTLTDGAILKAGADFIVGDNGNGQLIARSGSKITDTVVADVVIANSSASFGSVEVSDSGSSLTVKKAAVVGESGEGYLDADSGGVIVFPSDESIHLVLGNNNGSRGEMDVYASSFTDSGAELIGGFGSGVFTATNAALQTAFLTAPSAGGHAAITVDNSNWTNSYNLYLGNAGNPPGAIVSTLAVQNGATMRVGSRLAIFKSGVVSIDSASKMAVGTGAYGANGTLRVSTDGILSGYGNVNGKVIVGQGGEVLPGNSPGILTITGAYEQDAGSTYVAEIGGTTAGTDYDQIKVTGAATLGGTLKVRLVDGFTPTVGQTFQLLSAASKTGTFSSISQPSQAGIMLTTDAKGVTAKITSVVHGAPVISSPTTADAAPGSAFSYQINATNNPTSFGATNLPAGLTVNHTTGYITGKPTAKGTFIVTINANNGAGSGQADLAINIDPTFSGGIVPSNLLNISTRLDVQTGDNVLIAGFIITGTAPKKVLIRGLGPSLASEGVSGVLANPVLVLHKPDKTTVTNDNWATTQKTAIEATGLAPKNPLESAILATLAPGAYTAILSGNGNGTGVGLIEAYDLDQAAASQLANISTRGFVQTGDNILIGGFIVGGGGGGASTIVVRGLGPSLAGSVANPLQDPTLELHDENGATIGFDDDWKDAQSAAIVAAKLAPKDARESAIVALLPPGGYTGVVRGKNNTTGVGQVEVYNLH
jgi:T5SS/PEP-CTERM-associated repeat protein